jgi:hypothetical protein
VSRDSILRAVDHLEIAEANLRDAEMAMVQERILASLDYELREMADNVASIGNAIRQCTGMGEEADDGE